MTYIALTLCFKLIDNNTQKYPGKSWKLDTTVKLICKRVGISCDSPKCQISMFSFDFNASTMTKIVIIIVIVLHGSVIV